MTHSANRHYLAPLLEPASVAVIGASTRAGAIGTVLLHNLREAKYAGRLYAVNPRHSRVQGVRCYPAIGAVPGPVDLAVIATKAATVPELLEECGRAGVRAAVVISGGFGETGSDGRALEQSLLAIARRHGMRLLGPNCLGVLRPAGGLNASFARGGARAGSLGLISQSGAFCAALLDWALPHRVGFSSVVSLGASVDVDFGELIDYLASDPATAHILLYIEGVRDARRFVSALRAAARIKPVILMKVGRYPAGSRAIRSHTGTRVGMDEVFEAVVRRTGVVRVKTVGQLVAAAQALAARIRPQGSRFAIITNGGGPGVMAADRATELGLELAELAPATVETLGRVLPANWSHGNPLDLIGDADDARYRAAVEACLADPGVDGALVILTPQAMTDAAAVATAVTDCARGSHKPLLACWMGEHSVAETRRTFLKAHIPVFRTPEPAVDMFAHVSAYYRNQQLLLQTPAPMEQPDAPDVAAATRLIEAALAGGRRALSQTESKAVLAAFGIAVVPTLAAHSADEAVACAQRLGYPVALKTDSPEVARQSDLDGTRLNLAGDTAVRAAYAQVAASVARARPGSPAGHVVVEKMLTPLHARELAVGVLCDPVFGPAIAFGAGGTAAEVVRDRALDLAPLNATLARALIERTRVAQMLGAFRNQPPADMAAIETVLLQVSAMACELPWLHSLEINPLLVDADGAIAIDARIVVEPVPSGRRRYAHLAIHPYPAELVSACALRGGETVSLRPIRPEDAEAEQAFVRRLSPSSRYFRFMGAVRELTPTMLTRFTQIDYDREMAFVAIGRVDGAEAVVGVSRYVSNPDGTSCEFAAVVDDAWQRRGLGRILMERLIVHAKSRGLTRMIGHILNNNDGMLGLCAKLGFAVERDEEDEGTRRAVLPLAGA